MARIKSLWDMLRDGDIARAEATEILTVQHSMTSVNAEFYIALALGEIGGDVVIIEVENELS